MLLALKVVRAILMMDIPCCHNWKQIKQFTAVQPEQCFVDRGYRGHEVKDTKVFISGQKRGVTRSIKKALKRRSAIEPEIGHMKNDGRLDRCYLKGAVGDAINVVMVVAGHNLRKILNKMGKNTAGIR